MIHKIQHVNLIGNHMKLSILFLKSFGIMLIALAPIWGVLAITISILGISIGILEGIGWHEGLYFGWVTGTTVGYGDIAPTRPLTKLLSIVIGIIGITNTGIIVTIAVTAGKHVLDHEGAIPDMLKKVDSLWQKSSGK